jgi:hypothetical protein
MKYPGELYVSSTRPYRGLSDLEYPFHDRTITVTCCARICIGRCKINLSIVFAGQNVGVKEVSDKVWLVSFMQYDLGFFDHETGRITSVGTGRRSLPRPSAVFSSLEDPMLAGDCRYQSELGCACRQLHDISPGTFGFVECPVGFRR